MQKKHLFDSGLFGKAFKANQSKTRKWHRLIHTGGEPYQFNICEKTFTQNSTQAHHEKTHRGWKDISVISEKGIQKTQRLKKS